MEAPGGYPPNGKFPCLGFLNPSLSWLIWRQPNIIHITSWWSILSTTDFSLVYSFLFCPGRPSSWSWWTMQRSRSSRWTWTQLPPFGPALSQDLSCRPLSLFPNVNLKMKQISGHCWHDLHVKTVPEDQGQLWCKYEMNLDAILCLSDGAIKIGLSELNGRTVWGR